MLKELKKGVFVVFCGTDKSGKDSQANLLKEWLEGQGHQVILTYEPTRSNFWGYLVHFILKHHIPLPALWLQKLFFWDRRLHVKEIEKYLEQGYIALCIRYFFSSLAYVYPNKKLMEKILRWHEEAKIHWPDLVILLDISPEESMKRLHLSGSREELYEKKSKLEEARMGYTECESMCPDLFLRVNGGRELRNDVFEDIKKIVIKFLERRIK